MSYGIRLFLFAAILVLALLMPNHEAAFAQSPATTQFQELRRRLNSLLIAQELAESSWRIHQQYLVTRAATHGERFAAAMGEELEFRNSHLAAARTIAAQSRSALAQAQALLTTALQSSGSSQQVAGRLTTLLDQAQNHINQQNANFTNYQSSFHTRSSVAAFAAGPIDAVDHAITRIRNFINAPPYVSRYQRLLHPERHPIQRPAPSVTADSNTQPLYTNRQQMVPDAEANVIRAANDDMQRWLVRRQELLMRGRQGTGSLPPLLVPRFGDYLIESDFIRSRNTSAATRNEVSRRFHSRLDYYGELARTTPDPLLRLRRVASAVVRDFLTLYHRDDRSMIHALQGQGTNCEGRARMLYAVISALGLEMPTGYELGVQRFTDHIELVLYNPQARPPVIQLFSQAPSELTAAVYHPAVLLQDFIGTRSPASPQVVSAQELLLAAADPRLVNPQPPIPAAAGLGRFLRLSPGASATEVPQDGLGTLLPTVPPNYAARGPIPEFAQNSVPDADQPLAAPTANAVPVFGRPEPSRPSPIGFIDLQQDPIGFCNAMIGASGGLASSPAYADFRNQLIFRFPRLPELSSHPERLAEMPELLRFMTRTRSSTECLLNLIGSPYREWLALQNYRDRTLNAGQWHEFAQLTSALDLNNVFQACTIVRGLASQGLVITFNDPTPAQGQGLPVDAPQQETQSDSGARRPYTPADTFLVDPRSFQPPRVENDEPSAQHRVRIARQDVELILNSNCFSHMEDRADYGLPRAWMRSLCHSPQAGAADWNVLLSNTMPLYAMSQSGLAWIRSEGLDDCSPASMRALASVLKDDQSRVRTGLSQMFCSQLATLDERGKRVRGINRFIQAVRRQSGDYDIAPFAGYCPEALASPQPTSGNAAPGF